MEKYTKNPITEALIDIRIAPTLSQPLPEIERIHDVFKSEFPEKRTRHTLEAMFQLEPASSNSPKQRVGVSGFQFWKEDKKEVIQCEPNGFSYSRLKPYEHWEAHFPGMLNAWSKYADRFKPKKVTRTTTRFINLFEIPAPPSGLKDYFNSTPEWPPALPQNIGGFLQRLKIENGKNMVALVTFTTRRSNRQNITPILLDIEVYQNTALSSDKDAVREKIEESHNFAEEVFEGYITNKIRGLIT